MSVGSVLALISASSAYGSSGQEDPPDGPESTATATSGATTDGAAADGFSEEILLIAQLRGMTPEEAAAAMDVETTLLDFAESVRSTPAFVDFMLTRDGSAGILLLEPGTQLTGGGVPAKVDVRTAARPKAERDALSQEMEAAAKRAAGRSFVGVSYDAFADSYVVWIDDKAPQDTAATLAGDANLAFHRDLKFTTSLAPQTALFRGGQLATSGQGECTTGFGLSLSGGSYLTAGHCGVDT